MGTLKTAMDLNSEIMADALMHVFSPDDVRQQFILTLQIEEKQVKQIAPMLIECLSHFECKRCGECCRDSSVELKEEEALALAKRDAAKFFNSLNEDVIYCNALKAPCGYLKSNTCEVQDIKPFVCALYPFSFKYTGMITLHLCPLGKEIADEINRWSKEYYRDKPALVKDEKKRLEADAKVIVEFNRKFSKEIYDLLGGAPDTGRILEEMIISFSAVPLFLKYLKRRR